MGNIRRRAARAALPAILALALGGPARATGTIRTVTTAADDATDPPEGSLRHILAHVAQDGDTIVFAQNYSIQLDPRYALKVTPGRTGLTLRGPAELRNGTLVVDGDQTTVEDLRFVDTRVFGGTELVFLTGERTEGFVFRNNACVNDSGLFLSMTIGARVEGNTFDVRARNGDTAVGEWAAEGSEWTGNTWPDGSAGGFGELDALDLLFEGNQVAGDAVFGSRSGRVAGNTVTGNLRLYHSAAPVAGPLVAEGNGCGTLHGHRPDLEVIGNTVTGDPANRAKSVKLGVTIQDPDKPNVVKETKELLVVPFSVSNGQVAGDAGALVVRGNTVTATQGWISAMSVVANPLAGEVVVEENEATGGKMNGLLVSAAGDALVRKNAVHAGGKRGALVLQGAGGGVVTFEENVVTAGLGVGIAVLKGAGSVTFDGDAVSGCKGVGLQVAGRAVEAVDLVLTGNGGGARLGKDTVASVRGGSVTGNAGAGILADPRSTVEVARTVFGGNTGPGIDLAPGGVSANSRKKSANGNLGYPELLEYDAATGKVTGRAEPGARVDAYAVETGPRQGNPRNGEGVAWLGEVVAAGDGKFTFPAAGRVACPPSSRLCFTATRPGPAPATSEFSADVSCAGSPLVLVDRAPNGAPADDSSALSQGVLAEVYRTVSEDGRWVVFSSEGTNLVEGDTNGVADLFLRDVASGTTTRVTRAAVGGGEVAYEYSSQGAIGSSPSLSADGRWVLYKGRAQGTFEEGGWYFNDPGVVLYDAQEGTQTVVVRPQTDAPTEGGAWDESGAYHASLSGDGSAVVFTTRSQNESGGDVGDDVDVILWTKATGALERVSVPTGGGDRTNGWQAAYATDARLSHDARFVVFTSAQDLSAAGNLEYGFRVWLRDRQSGTTEAVSLDSTGAVRTGNQAWVSDDGRFVVFASYESLVPADTNETTDIYLRDRQAGTTTLVSRDAAGAPLYGDSFEPTMSGDGNFIAFRTFEKVRLLDRAAGTLTEVSGSPTVAANAYCYRPVLSRTGRFLAFETTATNLTDLDGQSFVTHVYLRDLHAGEE